MQKNTEETAQVGDLFQEINHISLNHTDLLDSFLEHTQRQNSYEDLSILDNAKINALLEYQDFIEAAVISARQAVVLSMLCLSLDKTTTDIEFTTMCEECSNIAGNKFLVNAVIKKISSIVQMDFLKFEKECCLFFKNFEKEIFSTILSKNKDMLHHTMVSKKMINHRKDIYFNILETHYA